jgi:hypothetical protein
MNEKTLKPFRKHQKNFLSNLCPKQVKTTKIQKNHFLSIFTCLGLIYYLYTSSNLVGEAFVPQSGIRLWQK